MEAKCRESLRKIVACVLGIVVFFGVFSNEVLATNLTAIMSLNAGAAKVIDSIDDMSMEEVTKLATSDDEEEAKEKEKYNMVMAKVSESMNIRELPDSSSEKVGLLYADCGGTILEEGDGWTKIQSGNLIGWAKNEYLVFGEDAYNLAQEVGINQATVCANNLRMRKEPTTESGIWKVVDNGEVFQAVDEYTTEEWIAVEYGGALGYISAEYVTMEFTIDHGETLEEIKKREEKERKELQKVIVSEGTSHIGTTDEMLLAALIQCEAANQPYEGQVAVGAVVVNRVNSSAYPNTIAGVIYASGQFTPTKSGRVETLAVKGVKDSCVQAARAAMAGESPVGGALHFRRVGNREGIVIGDHVFW
ncbi:MAG: cell wall hydrolase [Lachnospiraceae bacterium]|nr:cell wall hydrolase [Lachnospiraceae bacterium]